MPLAGLCVRSLIGLLVVIAAISYVLFQSDKLSILSSFGTLGREEESPKNNSNFAAVNEAPRKVDVRVYSTTANATWKLAMFHMYGRLGNQMFELASAYAIARTNGRLLVLKPTFKGLLQNHFPAITTISDEPADENYRTLYESRPNESKYVKLPPGNCRLQGYLITWRYFHEFQAEIRAFFRFNADIERRVAQFFSDLSTSGGNVTELTYVGVHVRRGDLINRPWRTKVDKAYLVKAMDYFRERYTNVRFVVCSDGIEWCKEKLGAQPNVTFAHFSAGMDMAILSTCHHSIISVGTYGWWAAWLANGTTVYYAKQFTGATKSIGQKMADRFYPHWVPLLG